MQTKSVELSKVRLNEKNPRSITAQKFQKLINSLLSLPKMLEIRPIVVDANGVALGGNMRFRALSEIAKMPEADLRKRLDTIRDVKKKTAKERTALLDYWVKWIGNPVITVVDASTLTAAEQKEFIIKDNGDFGSWDYDALANEWNVDDLNDWGVDVWQNKSVDDVYGDNAAPYEEPTASEQDSNDGSEFFSRENRSDNSREEGNDEYNEFLEKFETKKTTDDCYTPEPIYNAVVEWTEKEYGVKREDFVRPFYPGGNYQKFEYKNGSVVVDNPPFSILSEIIRFYMERGQKFLLFAPSLTIFSDASSSCCCLCIGASITYENRATVSTSFVTNLDDESIRTRTAPDLYKMIEEANKKFLETIRTNLPKYVYPDNVITSALMSKLSKYGQNLRIKKTESTRIGILDMQKEQNNAGIYGSGYLIGTQAAAEKAAAEKAAAEKAAAFCWRLSEREKQIIAEIDKQSTGT